MAEKKKIIMIDDEQDLCLFVKTNLEEMGEFTVLTLSNPHEALRLCLSEKPDLILLDIVMPEIDGTAIVKSLKKSAETSQIPIIIISGLGEIVYFKKKGNWKWLPNRPVVLNRGEVIREKDSERAAHTYGVDGYITKPFSTESLLETMREVLARVEAKRNEENPDETTSLS